MYSFLFFTHRRSAEYRVKKKKKSVPSSLYMSNHKFYLIISLRRHCRRGQGRRAWGYMSRPTDGSPHRHGIDRQSLLNARPTARQMHVCYPLMTQACDQGLWARPCNMELPRFTAISIQVGAAYHACKGLSEGEDGAEQISQWCAPRSLQWKWKKTNRPKK